jgi:hypothetical protein
VDGKLLSEKSDVFRASLRTVSRSAEPETKPRIELDLPYDDPEMMVMVLRVLHGRRAAVPPNLELDELVEIAKIVERYQLVLAIKPYFQGQFARWRTARTWVGNEQWMYVAYVFGEMVEFTTMAKHLVVHVGVDKNGQMTRDGKPVGLTHPHRTIGMHLPLLSPLESVVTNRRAANILEVRKKLIHKFFVELDSLLTMGIKGNLCTHTAMDPTRQPQLCAVPKQWFQAPQGANMKHDEIGCHCNMLMLGSAFRSLAAVGLFPWPATTEGIGVSLNTLHELTMEMWGVSMHPGSCSLLKMIQDIVPNIINRDRMKSLIHPEDLKRCSDWGWIKAEEEVWADPGE